VPLVGCGIISDQAMTSESGISAIGVSSAVTVKEGMGGKQGEGMSHDLGMSSGGGGVCYRICLISRNYHNTSFRFAY
jgi:hypothetical protein